MYRITLHERELRSRQYGRIARFLLLAGLAVLLCVIFCACAGDAVLTLLGFDMTDYTHEPVWAVLDPHTARAESLCDMVRVMASDPLQVPEFSSSREAVADCAESVLVHLLCSGERRTGGATLRARASTLYPDRTFTSLISASDFENAIYRYFGGREQISHHSDGRFTYLSKLGAYTTVAQPYSVEYTVDVLLLEETENTYRMTCRTAIADYISPAYRVIFIKRDDGTCYIHSSERLRDI
ncbi:MAG: hypothetical protein IKL84_06600 [Clostridia bacterium]|nr:hypothetical protein [Clostridia bacterium]